MCHPTGGRVTLVRSMGHQNFMSIELHQINATTPEFTLQLLDHITNHFSEESIIGRGGSGVVYKGVLDNGEEIAMKKLHQMHGLDEKQFTNEFNNLMRAKHKNIIRLVGYCYYLGHERVEHKGKYVFAHVQERLLCYEYLPGGSLDEHLSDESCGLAWDTRYQIIKGVCEGLKFLHKGSEDPICHLDLKPANILLDKDMIPKIADFGLSRLFASAQTHITTQIIGTLGYMPPEFIERGKITLKFDIFSLGVIIIKIIAGPDGYSKFADMPSEEFSKLVHENWAKRLHETMQSLTSQEIKTCIDIASRCVERDEEKRPCISEIINELNKIDNGIINEPDKNYSDIVDEQDKLNVHLVDEVDKIDGYIVDEQGKIDPDIVDKQDKLSTAKTSTTNLIPADRLDSLFTPRCVWVNGPIIIGAGPSGLAVAASLREHAVPFVMLEREDCIASLCRKRTYDSLKVNHPKQFCELPGMPLPDHFPEYLTRAHFMDYLQQYTTKFNIKPNFNNTVLSARFDETSGLWRVCARGAETDGNAKMEYISRWLVVATGAEAVVPDIPGLAGFCGEVTHSSDYSSGISYIGKRVLVVGSGQSGMEVSVDLCNGGAVPFMVVRNVLGIATLYLTVLLMWWLPLWLVDKIMALLAWIVFADLTRLGVRTPSVNSLTLKKTDDYGRAWRATARKIRSGEITVVTSVRRFTKSGAELSDDSVVDVDAVILATGYRSNVTQWFQGNNLFDENGWPKTSVPDGWKGHSGLYSVGFSRRGLLGASADAVCVAKDLGHTCKEETKPTRKMGACHRRAISAIF
ncbi:probable indole-3-pyruvate monooxygenase YUCCA8 isoform X2 [Triticum aestivum]|uniref:probable indole-3-pyruvate monooxygenase YUCCA8 isoform X2 n=1 Tax=Triticum aestivum TaxID=4565 RepID=UPI001D00B8D7|nr:probable indole-3-pyruvate monooxygenase YUCCA8 isoform X2 [Triticum aestivum]